jgi:hypothetical protein
MRRWGVAVLCVAAFGCGDADTEQTAANSTASNSTASGQGGMVATVGVGGGGGAGQGGSGAGVACGEGDYPAGPYGTQLGDVIANLQLRGYVNDSAEGLASAQPLVDHSFDDVRKSCKGYALVHVSDYT